MFFIFRRTTICSTTFSYNITSAEWTQLSNLTTPRSGHAMAVINMSVFACGGYSGSNFLSTCERYSIASDKWTSNIPRMPDAKYWFSMIAIDNTLYAPGGLDLAASSGQVDTVFAWKLGDTGWKIMPKLPFVTYLNGVVSMKSNQISKDK
jgi:hypothetical protein